MALTISGFEGPQQHHEHFQITRKSCSYCSGSWR
jgi:hypothetical protein